MVVMTLHRIEIADNIMRAGQLAAALEASGWPKPGNVHRTKDLPDTRYEHFLAGAVAMGPAIRRAALQGIKVGKGEIEVSEAALGRLVKQAISDVKKWHRGRNTHLGVCLLFIPLAASAGKTYAEHQEMDPLNLQKNARILMQSTTPQDAVEVYEAIRMVSSIQELGELREGRAPDLCDAEAKRKLLDDKVSLFEAMKTASSWDTIASEWATGMKVSFGTGYPTLMEVFQLTKDINTAIVHTYLTILSEIPDTFVARKIGLKETFDVERAVEIGRRKIKWISETAGTIMGVGGLTTDEGRRALEEFDQKLHSAKGELNPGTSADLTAASLMIAILCGLRF